MRGESGGLAGGAAAAAATAAEAAAAMAAAAAVAEAAASDDGPLPMCAGCYGGCRLLRCALYPALPRSPLSPAGGSIATVHPFL